MQPFFKVHYVKLELKNYSFSISLIYPAVIIPAGNATIAIPKTEDTIVTIRPIVVTG